MGEYTSCIKKIRVGGMWHLPTMLRAWTQPLVNTKERGRESGGRKGEGLCFIA